MAGVPTPTGDGDNQGGVAQALATSSGTINQDSLFLRLAVAHVLQSARGVKVIGKPVYSLGPQLQLQRDLFCMPLSDFIDPKDDVQQPSDACDAFLFEGRQPIASREQRLDLRLLEEPSALDSSNCLPFFRVVAGNPQGHTLSHGALGINLPDAVSIDFCKVHLVDREQRTLLIEPEPDAASMAAQFHILSGQMLTMDQVRTLRVWEISAQLVYSIGQACVQHKHAHCTAKQQAQQQNK